MSTLHRVRVYFNIHTYEGHKQDIFLIECYTQEEYAEKLANCKKHLADKFSVSQDRITTYTAELVKK